MRLKAIITVVVLVLLTLAVCLGFKLGENSMEELDVKFNIDLFTCMNQSFTNGYYDSVKAYIFLGVHENLYRYEMLKKDFLAKLVYGTKPTDPGFKRHLREAMAIEKNHIPTGPTNSPSAK